MPFSFGHCTDHIIIWPQDKKHLLDFKISIYYNHLPIILFTSKQSIVVDNALVQLPIKQCGILCLSSIENSY